MKLFKLLGLARSSLLKNKTRSLLTMFGIVIGVAAVIVMMAMGKGAQQNIEDRISSMGTNMLMIRGSSSSYGGVSRGAGSRRTLTYADVAAIRAEATQLAGVTASIDINGQVIGGGQNWYTEVQGVDPDFLLVRTWTLAEGAIFSDREVRGRAKVAVLGSTVAAKLFEGQSALGQSIRIRNVPFRVIGVLEAKGQNSFGRDQDDLILVPITTALFRLSGDQRYISQIYASSITMDAMEAAMEEITTILRRSHKLVEGQEDDFSIRTQTELTEAFTSTTKAVTTLLFGIAAVSLVVGGVGVMNIMLVSVTERTREIGIRVAVGARRIDVLVQFLIEAIVLSLTGGFMGVLLAWVSGLLAENRLGLTMIIESWVVLTSLGVSVAIGIVFGLFPAFKASKLDPIVALRHE